MKRVNISVLGAGIAGVVTAIGLKKLGFNVTIFYKQRNFTAYEGFSQKTKDGLLLSNCRNAASLLTKQSIRNANWGTKQNSVNFEFVVSRNKFDKSLIKDAEEFGIKCIEAKVIGSVKNINNKAKIDYKINSNILSEICDYVVDSRGRFTPYKDKYISGPKSFSLLQELETKDNVEQKTSIDSVKDGWIWQAYLGNNKGYIQFTCDESLANNVKNFEEVLYLIKSQSLDLWILKDSKFINNLIKRDSYSKIHKDIVTDKYILVGDSASSIDPLSGNGAFQALSMASVAPYVINTIFNLPKNKHIAKEFYKKRVNYIFDKFSNVGRDFYCMENRFDSLFWQKRQNWPTLKTGKYNIPTIKKEAILKDNFIYEHDVVITKDNPLGVWLLNNFDIVSLSKYCLNNSKEKAIKYFENFCTSKNLVNKDIMILKKWIFSQNIIRN
ncbi:hypothetical protein CRV00_01265 [Malaciobacter molluscorum]|uniref:flavin-dependent monooxygenase QhpG n=1 Tax=Malaciobacter molluscorum TaxID=1032072 RepID=UPI00100A2D5E|nr:tryptophan 7-halogenase [Malaciobacter molluscorum]RXJ97492.1 hypothetical protein CRV00_01265 [Malaciobacter molluscorum]